MKDTVRFMIVGSGWRAMYYARIAKALPDFELTAMLCRREEKKQKMEQEGIPAFLTREECLNTKPDFAVIAVDKPHMSETAAEWSKILPVLMETPAGTDLKEIALLAKAEQEGGKIAVAEQYRCYATHIAGKRLLDKGLIGEPYYLCLSHAHEYHGMSLIRYYLNLPCDTEYCVSAKAWKFPTVETLSRYERYTDGRIADKQRMLAVFEFANGKTCVYDFDSEQYRSPIRSNLLKIQGVRGEIIDEKVRWLDENNLPKEAYMQVRKRRVHTDNPNPNFSEFDEITGIELEGEEIYTPPFGEAGLSEDETAIACMLEQMRAYAKGKGENPYPLEEAIADSYGAILMKEAANTKESIVSAFRENRDVWMK